MNTNKKDTAAEIAALLAAKYCEDGAEAEAATARFAEMDEKALRLCYEIGENPDDCSEERWSHYGMTVFSIGGGEYAVGTESKADDAWNQALESYLEECIYPELKNETLRNYFDAEAWKRDARMDGRGHSLSPYDSDELDLGGGFVAFRTN